MYKICEKCRGETLDLDEENIKEKLLHFAITQQHDKCIEAMLEAGVDVNWPDKYSHPPLMRAAENGYLHGIKLLLEAGADVNKTTMWDNSSSLMSAASNGHDKCVDELIKAGADVNITTRERNTCAILLATLYGNVRCVELLINAGADVNVRHEYETTPIIQAVTNGNADIAEKLIKAGANVNDKDYCGTVAILIAACHGHCDVLNVLIKAGADVNEKDDWKNSTPLIEASECYKLHLETPSDDFARSLDLLIEAGAVVNATDSHGYSALIKAAENGNSKGTDILIKAGAIVNILNADNFTALMRAVSNGNTECAELLIETGVDVNVANTDGTTALMCVGTNTNKDMSEDPDYEEDEHVMESRRNYVGCAKLLLRLGAKINLNNNLSENALTYHLSFYRGHPDRIKKDVCIVLHAAGETIHNPSVDQPDFMKHDVTLKHLCREAIRNIC